MKLAEVETGLVKVPNAIAIEDFIFFYIHMF